jgi:uncharacterized protein
MLELRPSCEHCNTPLPPSATHARICSFECTFCESCVEHVLSNVCPNCGGGFCPRPIRPVRDWNGGNNLARYPPHSAIRHRPIEFDRHQHFIQDLRNIAPERR